MAGHLLNLKSARKFDRETGFTIVELLIVIVTIGILASITIVAFNGVQSRARVSQVASDLNSVSKKLNIDLTVGSGYPATLAATDGGKGIAASQGTSYQYTVDNTVNPPTFCVTAVNGGVAYFITQSTAPTIGVCPGHSATGVVAPSIAGYHDFSETGGGSNLTVNPSSAIAVGSWMIVVLTYNDTATTKVVPVMPSGWTPLVPQDITGTLITSVFAKIKTSSDPSSFQIGLATGSTTANGAILWGSGAGAVNTWTVGAIGKRDGSAGQAALTTTPTVVTTAAQSLVLSVSNERTAALETDITSLSGATRWFYVPQVGSGRIQTITTSYNTQSAAGTSTPVSVTYPNSQTINGMAFQIALPPAN